MSHFSSTPLQSQLEASATRRLSAPGGEEVSREALSLPRGSTRAWAEYSTPELWHLLSLDAPTVAVLWTVFLAQCVGTHLGWRLPVGLFLAVWILYAGDRLLDGRALSDDAGTHRDLLERHHFHLRYRLPFLVGMLVSGLLLLCVLWRVDRSVLQLYAAPGALLACWLVLVHGRRSSSSNRAPLPKELAVGLFFPVAVFVPSLAHSRFLGWRLLPLALAFAAVCTSNCLFLHVWEQAEHRGEFEAHITTRWGVRHLRKIALNTLTLSLAAGFLEAVQWTGLLRRNDHLASFGFACALAALLLLLLHTFRRRMQPLALRVAADAALLTPLLFLRPHA